MDGNIRLKYVNEFIDKTKKEIEFAVPDYQRGYKWTKENINELLTDIITLKDGEEYCLMPIIVRPTKDEKWKDIIEIVDGQQRLTTLQLIIRHIFNDDSKCRYSIPAGCYNDLDKKNVENASTAIKTFEKKDEIEAKLLPDGKRSPFYFIWYEINGSPIDAVNTFNRVNSWKIPLKESELAKAHILSAFGIDRYAERRLANIKWTKLEKLFNDNDFFSFFTIGKKKEQMKDYESAHMDLLLEIWAGITDEDREGQRYPIYKKITELGKTGADLLKELEDIANAMKFIHEDRVSFHLASYLLLRERISVAGIVKLYMSENSYHGTKVLLNKIKKEKFLTPSDGNTIINRGYIEGLSYWENKDKLNDILTMYNICDALMNNAYYDFYPTVRHSKQNWSLEHIHAKNEKTKDEKEIDSIISQLCKRFSAKEKCKWLQKEKNKYKEEKQKTLDSFYDEILYPLLGGVDIDDLMSGKNSIKIDWYETSIKNLALLPHNENSTFNNRNYLEKIEKLKSFDLSSYIPACTLQCFSAEAFSESGETIDLWTEKKGERYLDRIISTITGCLNNLENLELATIDFESKALKMTDHTALIAEKNTGAIPATISNKAYCLRDDDVKKILIPDFQRAYAQGRNTPQSKEIIENFINDIRKVLIGDLPALSLDFVYGRKNNGAFEPYDGQQRLTTLFLVYLYILRKADYEQNKNTERKGYNLSYRTSIEAGRFIDAITDRRNQIFFKQDDKKCKLRHLESQLYIDDQMLADDAVKNMLRTLSVIDEKLGDLEASTVASSLDNITFSLYDNLPDENPEVFYLRTNTRGLPLTPFENFRSKYEAYLNAKNNEATTSLSVTRDRMNRYFNWLYVHGEKTPDEKLMKLFVSYFSSLYTLYDLKEDETEKSKTFVPFQYFSTILNKFGEETVMLPILNLLDFLTNNEEENLNKITVGSKEDRPWFSEKIRNAIQNNTNSEYLLLVSFFFNVFDKKGFNEEKYKAYIRVVTNLINNNVSIKGNRELYCNISNSNLTESKLLQTLRNTKKPEDSRAAKTIAEEIKKLELIQADSDWRILIEKAESTAFADGFIDYLFTFDESKEKFEGKLGKFREYFDGKGVKEGYRTLLQTAYIRMLPDGCNLYEVQFFNFKRDNWRDNIFAYPDIYKESITNILTGNLYKEINNEDPNIKELKKWLLNPSNEWIIGVLAEKEVNGPPFIFKWSYDYPGFKQKNKRQYLLCDLYQKRYTELIRELVNKYKDDFKIDDCFKFTNPNNSEEFVVKPQDSWYNILFKYKDTDYYGFSVWGELIKYQQNWNQPTEEIKDFPIFNSDSCKTAEQVIAELDKLHN